MFVPIKSTVERTTPRSSPTSYKPPQFTESTFRRQFQQQHHQKQNPMMERRQRRIPLLSWISEKISFLALLIFLFGALHTLFLLSRVPITTTAKHKGWGPESKGISRSIMTLTNNTTVEAIPFTLPLRPNNETHAIPRVLLFTHYRDLLAEQQPQQQQQASSADSEEITALAANIRRIIHLHPKDTTVRFLTDEQCIESLQKIFPSLVPHFIEETQGMYKADICRGSALYETGGIYLDVDIGVRKDLWLDLGKKTKFVTSRVHIQSHYPKHFFQAILGVAPKSPILYQYLQLFEDHYTGKERVDKGPLGVILLRRAWDRVFDKTTGEPITELYQEVLYNKKLFPNLHPAPTWGSRRACHFVVVAVANLPENTELSIKGKNYHIPLYSRIAGSRMCSIHRTVP